MTRIAHIHAREVLDSRGQPTVEVEITCESGVMSSAIVPSGASTGTAEAHELRDGDPRRYAGRGVLKAVANVRDVLGPAVRGLDPADQAAVDARLLELDDTPQKTRHGANALLGVSLAALHAGAAARGVWLYEHVAELYGPLRKADAAPLVPRLPMPMTNMISGGLHAGGNLDFQDILIMPVGAAEYAIQLEWIVRTYRELGKLLTARGYEGRLVGDEGGFGPRLSGPREALELVVQATEAGGLAPRTDIEIALDVAATHFYESGCYHLRATGDERLSSKQMIDGLEQLVDEFPIGSIEDGLADEDWVGWQRLTARLGSRVRLVGDDLFATNRTRLERGIQSGVANAVLIKLNQIGTVTETLATMALAEAAGYRRVVSARSGETEDASIADLAVGTAAEEIKIGSIVRGERLAKYNRLLRIAERLSN
ncbi:MAG: phosphopyruvate hydratase [Pirellulales bacterium]|nr:phosphopyruvate hydratase [Pirellulales bacterium]